ncbi:MAG: HAD-IIB family hydrolase [Desulfobacterales bacterium]|nr:HAD-IIB family hydrolase [Desulfobacterales bacterium]
MTEHDDLYIQMFSIHGLVRAENMELGRDADTGGQVRYVVELGRHLARQEGIGRVDLFTRWISDKRVSEDYARKVEEVEDRFRIVRIRCGGTKYMRKEMLWPYLDEYVDKTIRFIKRENAIPDVVHGHYPDAGYVAMQLARIFGVPFVYTGHSLGRSKKEKLLAEGMKEEDIDKKYRIERRIHAEEDALRYADLVVTSTKQEIRKQYGMYRNKELPRYRVIPPGLDIDKFYPFYRDMLPENEKDEEARYAQASVFQELERFFMQPDKPLILALCRPDRRKNISGLVEAFGEDKELQTMANLAVFAGIRKDISDMEENEREVLTDMLLLMDKYDLYGKMAIPKKHEFEYEVPELYRVAAAKRGVFVNPALTEPFGITLLEASSTGLPIVATNDGGPWDIMENCRNGILIDPTDSAAIAAVVKEIISDSEKWEAFSKNGIMNVRKHYTWSVHAERYRDELRKLMAAEGATDMRKAEPKDAVGRRLACLDYFLITDIDNTLIGEDNSRLPELLRLLEENRGTVGFGVATGRRVDSAVKFLEEHGLPKPDVVVASVGSEIYYGPKLHPGQGWETHISSKWNRQKIVDLLSDFDFLEYQEEAAQRPYKVSYNMKPKKDRLAKIHNRLLAEKCRYTLIYSHEKYLDILPFRASKGKAIRYLSYKWEIPLRNFLVCGDSGNDEEMLRGEPMAVVVGNYSPEIKTLKGSRRVFFAKAPCAGGIIEGMKKYRFLEKASKKDDCKP